MAATSPYTAPAPSSAPNFDINSDPGYQAALAAANQGNSDINTGLNKGLSSLLIGYGSPALASQLSQYGYSSNPNDAAAAQANYDAGNATLARLNQQHDLNRQSVINNLAAHGIIRSGDLGYKLGQEDRSYGQGQYDASQNLLNQAYNLQQGALGQKNSLQQQLAQALQAAWQNFTSNPGAYAQQPAAPTGGQNVDYGMVNTPPEGWGQPLISPNESATDLQQTVSTPNAQGVYPYTNEVPTAIRVSANPSGASANKKQGVFAIH